MRTPLAPTLSIDTSLLKPGLRVAVGVSGGADSVALLRVLAEQRVALGLVLHVAHLHHGLRGAEADGDLEFCRALAADLELPFHEERVDTATEAKANPESGKKTESLEEAARRLRYGWFRGLMAKDEVDAVATAHTLDDQAETVLAKFLRGAWTEGLSGIHSVVQFPEGRILRPLVGVTRAEVEGYLKELGQEWRDDSSNRHLTFTRNRIRHELLPLLETWNPRLREHLAQMAELARIAPQLLLRGRAVRGGGRAAGDGISGISIDVSRLAALPVALQRRLLRFAAESLGARADFAATEALRGLALRGRAGQKRELAQGLRGERTARELGLRVGPATGAETPVPEYTGSVPGEILGPAFGLRLEMGVEVEARGGADGRSLAGGRQARLRNWKPGDRVRLRHASGPRKVKEVLERLKVTGTGRALWPVLEVDGAIVWMRGVEVEPEHGIVVVASALE